MRVKTIQATLRIVGGILVVFGIGSLVAHQTISSLRGERIDTAAFLPGPIPLPPPAPPLPDGTSGKTPEPVLGDPGRLPKKDRTTETLAPPSEPAPQKPKQVVLEALASEDTGNAVVTAYGCERRGKTVSCLFTLKSTTPEQRYAYLCNSYLVDSLGESSQNGRTSVEFGSGTQRCAAYAQPEIPIRFSLAADVLSPSADSLSAVIMNESNPSQLNFIVRLKSLPIREP